MKRRVVTILLAIFLITPLFFAAFAQTPYNTKEDVGQANDDFRTTGDVTSPVHVADVETARQWVLVCQSIGIGCTEDPSQQSSFLQNSVVGQVSNGIAYLYYQKPADTSQFIAYYGQKLGIVKPAYAQGIGFSGLSPLLPIWRAFRNIAYGFVIIMLVVVGFMIMFRMKIDPRTVISVQNSIPRIIITLFLITFSYAIVGLLIDFMYILLYLTITALNSSVGLADLQGVITTYSGSPLTHLWSSVFAPSGESVKTIAQLIGGSNVVFLSSITAIIGLVIGTAAFPAGGPVIGLVLGGGAPTVLIWLIVSLALLFTFFRIFFMLLVSYIQIIISVIFAPFQLMLGVIPNNNSFGNWFRDLISNLAVFPITSIMLLLGHIISAYATRNQSNFWVAPGVSSNAGTAVAGIIGFGIVVMIPNIVNSFKEALKAKPLFPAGSAVGQAIGAPWSTGMQLLSTLYYVNMLTPTSIKERLGLGGAKKEPQHG